MARLTNRLKTIIIPKIISIVVRAMWWMLAEKRVLALNPMHLQSKLSLKTCLDLTVICLDGGISQQALRLPGSLQKIIVLVLVVASLDLCNRSHSLFSCGVSRFTAWVLFHRHFLRARSWR